MSRILSAEDQLMITTYYYMKANRDCKNVSDALRLIDEGKFIISHSGTDTDEKVDVTDRNVFVLRGRQSDGRKSKNCAKIMFEQSDSGLRMRADKNSNTALRMSSNYIEHILEKIEATDSSKIELKDITTEIEGRTVIIPADKQKEFFEELLKVLKDKLKETEITGRRGKVDRNIIQNINVATTNNIDNSINSISSSSTETDINNLATEIEQISNNSTISINNSSAQNFNTVSSTEIAQNINDQVNVTQIQKKIDKLKNKIETEGGLSEDIVNKIKEQIAQLEGKVETIKNRINEFEVRISDMIEDSSTTTDIKILDNLISFYNNIIIKCNEQICKLDKDDAISPEEKAEKIEQLNLIVNNCQNRITMIRQKINNIEKDMRPVHNEYNTYNTNNTNSPSKTEPEKPEKTADDSENHKGEKKLTVCLNYTRLRPGDRYRAKVAAYAAANGKEPNLFQKLRLLLPSKKYSELAKIGIDNGSIDLNKTVKDIDKYNKYLAYEQNGKIYNIHNGLEMYKVNTTPVPTIPREGRERAPEEDREER